MLHRSLDPIRHIAGVAALLWLMPRRLLAGAVLLAHLLSACGSPSERAAMAAARSDEAFSVGDYQRARLAISEALSDRDDIPAYWLRLARTEAALEQYERAYAAYERALELDPNDIEALQNMAELQVLQQDYELAEKTADRILQIDANDPRAKLVRGYVDLARGDGRSALAISDEVLVRYPADDSALLLRARSLDRLNRRTEAVTLLEQSLRVTGVTQPKLEALRDMYLSGGDWPNLKRTFENMLRLSPADNDRRLEFAKAAFQVNDAATGNSQSVAIFRSAAPAALLEKTADVLLEFSQISLDQASLEQLAADAPAVAKLALGRVAVEKGFGASASRILQPLLTGDASTIWATATALQALNSLKQGNLAAARDLADKALTFDNTNMTALLVRARAALAEGRLDDALASAQLLAAEDPSRHQSLLAEVHRARGNPAVARALLARGTAAARKK